MADYEPQVHHQRPKAELGCWTLVIIAVIVMVFSDSGDNRKMRKRVDALGEKIDRLEQKIDALTAAQEKAAKPQAAPAPVTATTTTK